jgi:hypothetical protein
MSIKGMPRGIGERHASEILEAVERGLAVPDAELPQFPRAPRWDKDPDFDARVNALRTVRDEAAKRLDLDPGVLGSRERLESIARRMPQSVDDLFEIPDLRRWQIEEFGEAAVKAVNSIASAPPGAGQPAAPSGRRPRGGRGRTSGGGGASSAEASGQETLALGSEPAGAQRTSSSSSDASRPSGSDSTAGSRPDAAPGASPNAPDAPAAAPDAPAAHRPATLPPRPRSGGRGGLGSRRGSPPPSAAPDGGTNGGAPAGESAPVNGPVSPPAGGRAGAPLRKGEHKDDRSPYRDD